MNHWRARRNAILALVALAFLAGVINALAPVGPLRTAVSVAAALLVPGGAMTLHMNVTAREHVVALALGLSVAVETLLALAMVWTGWWHPVAVASALLGVSVAALAQRLLVEHRAYQASRMPEWSRA
jgi:uncharacterized membrane protein